MAIDKYNQSIKTGQSKHVKMPSMGADGKSINIDGPIIASNRKEYEAELERRKNQLLTIDLEQ